MFGSSFGFRDTDLPARSQRQDLLFSLQEWLPTRMNIKTAGSRDQETRPKKKWKEKMSSGQTKALLVSLHWICLTVRISLPFYIFLQV